MEYENGHSGFIEYHVDKPELLHDPYHYENLETYQVPNLEKELIKQIYKGKLKFAKMIKN